MAARAEIRARRESVCIFRASFELRSISEPVDVFINDSDHSPDYELDEYHAIAPRLSRNAYLIGDNAHCSDRLYRFAGETGREFLFFREQPKEHWYPGGGMGIAFRPRPSLMTAGSRGL